MNRQDIRGPTEELIAISEWIADHFPAGRLDTGPALQLYRGDLERDAVSGSLTAAGDAMPF